jgi:hypothetical protein
MIAISERSRSHQPIKRRSEIAVHLLPSDQRTGGDGREIPVELQAFGLALFRVELRGKTTSARDGGRERTTVITLREDE